MNLSLILFLIGILGFVLNRKNIILMLISIEIMLLAITFLILVSSLSFDDILGQTYAIYSDKCTITIGRFSNPNIVSSFNNFNTIRINSLRFLWR